MALTRGKQMGLEKPVGPPNERSCETQLLGKETLMNCRPKEK